MTNLEWLREVITMTNLEWLKNLPEEELIKELSTVYNKEWLNAEHTPKIKPCPVCKGKMNIRWQHSGCYLVCEDCGLHFGLDTDKAKEALIDAWNRRIDDGEVDGD